MERNIKKIATMAVLGMSIMAVSCAQNDKVHERLTEEHVAPTEDIKEHEDSDYDPTLGEEIENGADRVENGVENAADHLEDDFDGDGTTEQPDPDEKEIENVKPHAQ